MNKGWVSEQFLNDTSAPQYSDKLLKLQKEFKYLQ